MILGRALPRGLGALGCARRHPKLTQAAMSLNRSLLALLAASTLLVQAAHAQTVTPGPVEPGPTFAAECPALESGLDSVARAALDGGVPGLVIGVARPGAPPLVLAYGVADLEQGTAMEAGSVFRIASLTKAFTAAAVLRLVADGRLTLDQRAAELLPDRPWLGDITVEQLLNHTSGLADYAEDPAGANTRSVARTSAEMVDWIERLDPLSRFEPGAGWAYSNSNYAVLGLIMEAVSGRPYAEVLHDAVLSPAGLTATAVDDPSDLVAGRVRGYSLLQSRPRTLRNADWIHPTIPGPAGSLRATAGDVLAWNEALFGGQIIPLAFVERMTQPGLLSDGRTTRWGMPEAWREGLNSDYAMGVFVASSPLGPRVWHTGDIDGFASWMAHWPDAGFTAVVLTNADFRSIDADAIEALVAQEARCGETI